MGNRSFEEVSEDYKGGRVYEEKIASIVGFAVDEFGDPYCIGRSFDTENTES